MFFVRVLLKDPSATGVKGLPEVCLGHLPLSLNVQRGPAPTAPETQRKSSRLSFVCMLSLTQRTMPSAALEAARTAGCKTCKVDLSPGRF